MKSEPTLQQSSKLLPARASASSTAERRSTMTGFIDRHNVIETDWVPMPQAAVAA